MNSATKSYVAQFRIKELKSALDQLSLPTSGRKAELQARLGAYFGEPVPNNIFCNVEPAKEEWRLQAAGQNSGVSTGLTEQLATGLTEWLGMSLLPSTEMNTHITVMSWSVIWMTEFSKPFKSLKTYCCRP